MPTVLRIGSLDFISTQKRVEPPHIHIEYGASECKFRLSPISLQETMGLNLPN